MARMEAEGREVTALCRAAVLAQVQHEALDAALADVREALIALRAEHGALRLGRMLGISDQHVRNLCAGRQQAGRDLIAKMIATVSPDTADNRHGEANTAPLAIARALAKMGATR